MRRTGGISGRESRRRRLLDVMDRHRLGALLLRRSANFAWYTNGADNRVDHASPLGVADVLVTPDAEYVFTNNIEGRRMREEQTPGFEVVERPWHEGESSFLRELAGKVSWGADFAMEGAVNVSEEVSSLRRVLDEDAIERYRAVGADAAAAIAEAADFLEPGMSEREAAAELAGSCRRRGLFSSVILAAADGRIANHRHPIPHDGVVSRRAMLVVSAERGGLCANLTRIVHFEEPDAESKRKQRACDEILRRTREEATLPGRTLAEAFADCLRFYAEAGYPDEWRLHHQGGMTGYASREVIATPDTTDEMQPGQAFAWNPSITGAKAEETFILSGDGPEVVTVVGGH